MLLTADGKIVGSVINGVYVTYRNRGKHFYFKRKGYPISDSVLLKLKRNKVERIKIIEKPSGRVYEATVEKYLKAKLFREPGHDAQRVVPLELLEIRTNQMSLPLDRI